MFPGSHPMQQTWSLGLVAELRRKTQPASSKIHLSSKSALYLAPPTELRPALNGGMDWWRVDWLFSRVQETVLLVNLASVPPKGLDGVFDENDENGGCPAATGMVYQRHRFLFPELFSRVRKRFFNPYFQKIPEISGKGRLPCDPSLRALWARNRKKTLERSFWGSAEESQKIPEKKVKEYPNRCENRYC